MAKAAHLVLPPPALPARGVPFSRRRAKLTRVALATLAAILATQAGAEIGPLLAAAWGPGGLTAGLAMCLPVLALAASWRGQRRFPW